MTNSIYHCPEMLDERSLAQPQINYFGTLPSIDDDLHFMNFTRFGEPI